MKKTMSFLLAMVMILSTVVFGTSYTNLTIFTVNASAETANSGSCGENVVWSYNESSKTLTINGSGKMSDYEVYAGCTYPWGRYSDEAEKVVIDDGVTSIGDNSFFEFSVLKNISISNTVTSIGYNSFYNCSSLESITIPDNVLTIDSYAFEGCTSLITIVIPKDITIIQSGSFYGCESLTSVSIPKTVKTIGILAFQNCHNLKDVYYDGTEEDWNAVSIAEGNNALNNSIIHFTENNSPSNPSEPEDPSPESPSTELPAIDVVGILNFFVEILTKDILPLLINIIKPIMQIIFG